MFSSACSVLQGRTLTIPRKVLLQDINHSDSREPRDGDAWRATVTEYRGKVLWHFSILLQVLDEHDEVDDAINRQRLLRYRYVH